MREHRRPGTLLWSIFFRAGFEGGGVFVEEAAADCEGSRERRREREALTRRIFCRS